MINIKRIKTLYEMIELEGEMYNISNITYSVRITNPIIGLHTGMIFAFDIKEDIPMFIENGVITELAIDEGKERLRELYEDYLTFKEHKDEIVKEYVELNKEVGDNQLKAREARKIQYMLNKRIKIYSKLLNNGEIIKEDYEKKIKYLKEIYNISNSPVMEKIHHDKSAFDERLKHKYDLRYIDFDNIPNVLGNLMSKCW